MEIAPTLYADVLTLVFAQVNLVSLGRCTRVCKAWKNTIERQPSIWFAQVEQQKKIHSDYPQFVSDLQSKIAQINCTAAQNPLTVVKLSIAVEGLKSTVEFIKRTEFYLQLSDTLKELSISSSIDSFWEDSTTTLIALIEAPQPKGIDLAVKALQQFKLKLDHNKLFDLIVGKAFGLDCYSGPFCAKMLSVLVLDFKLPKLDSQLLAEKGLHPNDSRIAFFFLEALKSREGSTLSSYVNCGLFSWNSYFHYQLMTLFCNCYVGELQSSRWNNPGFKKSSLEQMLRWFEEGARQISAPTREDKARVQQHFQSLFESSDSRNRDYEPIREILRKAPLQTIFS